MESPGVPEVEVRLENCRGISRALICPSFNPVGPLRVIFRSVPRGHGSTSSVPIAVPLPSNLLTLYDTVISYDALERHTRPS